MQRSQTIMITPLESFYIRLNPGNYIAFAGNYANIFGQ